MMTAAKILDNIIGWGRKEELVRVLVLTGSRAQRLLVDELADFDISVFAEDYKVYLREDGYRKSPKVWDRTSGNDIREYNTEHE